MYRFNLLGHLNETFHQDLFFSLLSDTLYCFSLAKQQIEFTIHDPSQILKDEKMMEMLNNDDDKGVSFTWNSDPIASVLHSNNETNKKNQQTKNQNKTRNFQIFFNLKSYRPYFIISISLLQIVIFVIELIYNQGVTPGWWINLNQTTLINMGGLFLLIHYLIFSKHNEFVIFIISLCQ